MGSGGEWEDEEEEEEKEEEAGISSFLKREISESSAGVLQLAVDKRAQNDSNRDGTFCTHFSFFWY